MGLDIGAPAGQQKPVNVRDDRVEIGIAAQGRDQHRGRAGAFRDGPDVRLAGSVQAHGTLWNHAHAHRHPDDRMGGTWHDAKLTITGAEWRQGRPEAANARPWSAAS